MEYSSYFMCNCRAVTQLLTVREEIGAIIRIFASLAYSYSARSHITLSRFTPPLMPSSIIQKGIIPITLLYAIHTQPMVSIIQRFVCSPRNISTLTSRRMATVKASLSHLERTADEPRDNVSSGLERRSPECKD
jgi:hypothetical protein